MTKQTITEEPDRLTHEQANSLRLRTEWVEAMRFDVVGTPQQRGSKTPWNPRTKDGSLAMKNGKPVIATMDSNKKAGPWMNSVSSAAHEAWGGLELLNEPIAMSIAFRFKRPKSHFGNGSNAHLLKPDAPIDHDKSPDLDKLVRAIGDALTGVVIHDDKLICKLRDIDRVWTTSAEGATVILYVRKKDQ